MNIKEKYRNFLRKLIDEKYLQKHKYAMVLAENNISEYYFVVYVVEDREWEKIQWQNIII